MKIRGPLMNSWTRDHENKLVQCKALGAGNINIRNIFKLSKTVMDSFRRLSPAHRVKCRVKCRVTCKATWAFLIIVLFLTQACASGVSSQESVKPTMSESSKSQQPIKGSIREISNREAELYKQINQSLDLRCETQSQCKSIGVGLNPCGGVGAYKIYSTLNTDETRIKELASEYSQVNRYMNKKLNRVGLCVYLQAPILICENERCITNSRVRPIEIK